MGEPKKPPRDSPKKISVRKDEEESTPKSLPDLHITTVGYIIEESNYKEQLILRKVCKPLRALVDERKPNCKSIRVMVGSRRITCKYDGFEVTYASPRDWWHADSRTGKNRIERVGYKRIAFDDLMFTLKNPELKLDYFEFDTFIDISEVDGCAQRREWFDESFKKFEDLLKSINHQLSTKKFGITIAYYHHLPQLLPYFKPGVLEKISLNGKEWIGEEAVEIIKKAAETEQWKQAVELELDNIQKFPFENANNFRRYTLRVGCCRSVTNTLAESLSKLDNFECICIHMPYNIGSQYIKGYIGEDGPPHKLTEHVRHYYIANSNEFLEFLYFPLSVTVEKKKRNFV